MYQAKPGNGHTSGHTGMHTLGHTIRVCEGDGDKVVGMCTCVW